MIKNKLLSIVIPSLDIDLELNRCIESALLACSELESYEVIIVVPLAVYENAKLLYKNIKVIQESRNGIYSAMNDGLKASIGDYIFFLGKDDILLPGFEIIDNVLTKNKPYLLIFNVFWGNSKVYVNRPNRFFLIYRNLCHQGIIYSRSTFSEYGKYNIRMKYQADHYLNIKILWDLVNFKKIIYINKSLVWYSGSGISTLGYKDLIFSKFYPLILKKNVGTFAMFLLCIFRILKK